MQTGNYRMSGGCHCGSIRIELELTRPPATYNPRACDCDFCRKHGAAYVSDPNGSLCIRVNDEQRLVRYRQGLAIAEFILCGSCRVMVAATLHAQGSQHAVCNARVLDTWTQFGAEESVSPKHLSASERTARWQTLWFRNVSIAADCAVRSPPGQ